MMNPRRLGLLLLLGILGPSALWGQGLREEVVRPMDAGGVSAICGTAYGTLFNLEPRTNAEFQVIPAVDVLRNRVAAGVDLVVGGSYDGRFVRLSGSGSGYYVSRDADCAPEFEGNPPRVGEFTGGEPGGGGRPRAGRHLHGRRLPRVWGGWGLPVTRVYLIKRRRLSQRDALGRPGRDLLANAEGGSFWRDTTPRGG